MTWGEDEDPGLPTWGKPSEGSSWGASLPTHQHHHHQQDDGAGGAGWGQQPLNNKDDDNDQATAERGSPWGDDPLGGGWPGASGPEGQDTDPAPKGWGNGSMSDPRGDLANPPLQSGQDADETMGEVASDGQAGPDNQCWRKEDAWRVPPAPPAWELFRKAPESAMDDGDGKDKEEDGMATKLSLVDLIDAAEESEQIDEAMMLWQWQCWQQQQRQHHPDLMILCLELEQLGHETDHDYRIKVPRGRMGGAGAAGAGAGGSFTQSPASGFNSTGGAFPSSGGGFAGKLFSIPGQQAADAQPAPSMMAAGGMGSTGMNSGASNFNFGASTGMQSNMFGADQPAQSNAGGSPAPFSFGAPNVQAGGAFGGNNANPFASQTSAQTTPSLFGASNAQGAGGLFESNTGSTPAASPSVIFGQPKESTPAATAAPTSSIFGSANSNSQSDSNNPFKPAAAPIPATTVPDTQPQSTPNLFGSMGQSNLFKPSVTPTTSTSESQTKTTSSLFGSTGQSNTASLFNFASNKPTEAPGSSATTPQSLFGQSTPSTAGGLFGNPSGSTAAATPAATAASSAAAVAEPKAANPFASPASKPLFGTSIPNEPALSHKSQAPLASTASLFAASANAAAPDSVQKDKETNASKATPSSPNTKTNSSGNSWVPNPTDPDGGFWTPGKAAPPSLFSMAGQQQQGPAKAVESPQKASSPMQTSPSPATVPAASAMPTLNSSAAPTPATATVRVMKSIDDVYIPDPPSHYNDEQRAQWPIGWKLRALLDWFSMSMSLYANDQNRREALIEYYLKETERLRALLPKLPLSQASTNTNAKSSVFSANKSFSSQAQATQQSQQATPAASLFAPPSTGPASNSSSSSGITNLFGTPKTTTAATGGSSTGQSLGNAASLFGAGGGKRKPESQATSEESRNDAANQSGASSKKSRTDDVSYPSLPDAAGTSKGPAQPAGGAPVAAGFSVPNLGGSGASGTNFFAQFGAAAKKAEEEAAKKRKAQEYDSEEEDEETWEKRDAEKQAAEKARLEKLSKDASLGFKIPGTSASKAPGASLFGSSTSAPETTAPVASSGGSLFSKSVPAATGGGSQTSNLFAASVASSAAKPTSLFSKPDNSSGSATQATEKADAPKASLFSFGEASNPASSSSGSLFSTPSSSSVIPAQKALPSNFSFSQSTQATTAPGSSLFGSSFAAKPAGSLGTSLFGSSSKGPSTGGSDDQAPKPSASTGGLFDRIDKDKEGNVVKEGTDNTFKGDSSTPIKFSKSLPSTLAPPSVASDTSRATTPGTVGDDTDNGGAVDDDAAPPEKQLDLSQSAVGEEDEEVLGDVRAKGSEMVKGESGKMEWKVRGVGQLKLLKHKETGKTRIVLRSSPAAKIVLNTSLLAKANYESSGAKSNNIRLPVPTADGHISQWVIMVKDAKDAQDLASKMNENKEN